MERKIQKLTFRIRAGLGHSKRLVVEHVKVFTDSPPWPTKQPSFRHRNFAENMRPLFFRWLAHTLWGRSPVSLREQRARAVGERFPMHPET